MGYLSQIISPALEEVSAQKGNTAKKVLLT